MSLENIKLECWYDSDGETFFVRASHDTANGSSIVDGGKSLVEALGNLVERIKATNLGDRSQGISYSYDEQIWQSPKVKGVEKPKLEIPKYSLLDEPEPGDEDVTSLRFET